MWNEKCTFGNDEWLLIALSLDGLVLNLECLLIVISLVLNDASSCSSIFETYIYYLNRMLELVFGPESTFVPPKDPVDRRLHKLIRNTLKQASTNVNLSGAPVRMVGEAQDDISLTTTIGGNSSSAISSDSYHGIGDIGANANGNIVGTEELTRNSGLYFHRSNSLPDLQNVFTATNDIGMDTTEIP
jgi:hypothetical protein